MSTAELSRKKLDLISWINSLSDESMIHILETLRSSASPKDWWSQLSESQQESIEKGLKDYKEGQIVSSIEFWETLKNA